MGETITEKNYPIRNIWFLKRTFPFLVIFPIYFFVIYAFLNKYGAEAQASGLVVFTFFPILIVAFSVQIITEILQRSRFHYSCEDHFIVLHQGIISKQNRNVPYGRIQGVFINQGLFERIFGLASLTFEDYSQGGTSLMNVDGYVGTEKTRHEAIGFVGNRIHIPGLKKDDAEKLKAIILQKIKDNPIEDNQSGL